MKKTLKILKQRLRGIPAEGATPGKYFAAVYETNFWNGKNSRSGTGSEGIFADQKKKLIVELIDKKATRSLLDLGCGDFYWMKDIANLVDKYHGVDVVENVIIENQQRYSTQNISFQCLDLSQASAQANLKQQTYDLVICFDVIGHMLNEEVDNFLDFVVHKLKTKYFLVTNRRDEKSELYLQRPKSRREGINIQKHPIFVENRLIPIWQQEAQYPGDYFELYSLTNVKMID